VSHPSDLEARLAALEARVEEVAADAAAARGTWPRRATATWPTSG
jgi:hypothetical protein